MCMIEERMIFGRMTLGLRDILTTIVRDFRISNRAASLWQQLEKTKKWKRVDMVQWMD